jgi:hypothetical protein
MAIFDLRLEVQEFLHNKQAWLFTFNHTIGPLFRSQRRYTEAITVLYIADLELIGSSKGLYTGSFIVSFAALQLLLQCHLRFGRLMMPMTATSCSTYVRIR